MAGVYVMQDHWVVTEQGINSVKTFLKTFQKPRNSNIINARG